MFDEDKGFGFIGPDDGSDDVFVHRKLHGGDRTAYLIKGDHVIFEKEWDEDRRKHCASSCTGFKSRESGGGSGGSRRGVCRHFQEGKCARGDRCKFSHEGRGGSRSRSRSRDRGGRGGSGIPRVPPQGNYGMPPPGYGYPPPGYGMPPPFFGMPPPGFTMPPPSYGMPPPSYGMPPPGYGMQPSLNSPAPLGYGGPPHLPAGWEQMTDPASGRPYFCNRASGETSWTAPVVSPPALVGPPSVPPGGALPQGWEQASDPASGRPYFFNRTTGATQWTPP